MWSMRTNIEHGGLRITHWGPVAARHSWQADARDNGVAIFSTTTKRPIHANKVYAVAKRDWKCRYG
jgi:hypothetical protein